MKLKDNTLYKRIMFEGYQSNLEQKEAIIFRTQNSILPSGLIHHQKSLALKKRANSVLLDDYKNGLSKSINLELKLDEKYLPHDLKQFHSRLVEKHNFEEFEKRQMRERRRQNRLKRRIGRIALGRRNRGATNNTGSSSYVLGGVSRQSRSRSSYNNLLNNPSKDTFQSDSSSIKGAQGVKMFSGNKEIGSTLLRRKKGFRNTGNLNPSKFENSAIQNSLGNSLRVRRQGSSNFQSNSKDLIKGQVSKRSKTMNKKNTSKHSEMYSASIQRRKMRESTNQSMLSAIPSMINPRGRASRGTSLKILPKF